MASAPLICGQGKLFPKSGKPSWSAVFGKKIVEIAKHNPKVVGITAAMCSGTACRNSGRNFRNASLTLPLRSSIRDNLCGRAGKSGDDSCFCSVFLFLQRAYDQIIHDVCMENLHVVFAIDRAGIVGADGETHQGVFDLSFLRHIPNMAVLSPKNQ